MSGLEARPNVTVESNVIEEVSPAELLVRLPGDLAVQVYGGSWLDVGTMRSRLTDRQWIEHLQYLVCERCLRPCAGTCPMTTAPDGRPLPPRVVSARPPRYRVPPRSPMPLERNLPVQPKIRKITDR